MENGDVFSVHVLLSGPPAHQAQIISDLFWMVWIDECFYTVSRSENLQAIYEEFRAKYPFPKFQEGGGFSHMPPWWFDQNPTYSLPSATILTQTRDAFWNNEVAAWLHVQTGPRLWLNCSIASSTILPSATARNGYGT